MTQVENTQKTHRTFLSSISIILGTTLLGAIVAYGGSYLKSKTWLAEAHVTVPDIALLGNYYALSSTYQFIKNKENQRQETEIVYQEFLKQLMSEEMIRRFWEKTEYYKQKQTGEDHIDLALLEKLTKAIKFKSAQTLDVADSVSLTLENPKLATELLSSFIDQVNVETRKIVYSNLISQWKVLFEQVKKATEFNLGKNAQSALVLEDWNGKLQMMRSVSPLDEQFSAYRYLKKPTQPIMQRSPNRKCWASVGALIGFILSFFMLSLFNSRKKLINTL
ncbi:LPS O-antigen chain length determinant protein WzzB [Pasteurella multocida]|uniref:LPS O-antigen chain length determinant protein WzzB n=1 Tax=Pasteurella multocida TaxID=747 RepID=UPI00193B4E3C|nr:LPS O-antigen chain length determinant protein WzzB [Pasteurella multocida]MBM2607751.1 LPS O-antigen chain length determinant protein WzzB [Pasteurella multocida]